MFKPIKRLATISLGCLLLASVGCDDAGVAPIEDIPPVPKVPSIMRTPPLLTTATEATLLCELSGEHIGPLLIAVGDRVQVNGRSGYGELNLPPSAPVDAASNVGDLVDWLDPQSAGVYAEIGFASGGRLTFNIIGGERVEGFSATIPGKTAFNIALSFPSSMDLGLTVSETALLAPANADTRLYELYSSWGHPLIPGFSAATTIMIGGILGSETLQPASFALEPETTLNNLMALIESVFGLEAGAVVIDVHGQITVTGRPGVEFTLGDVDIVPNTIWPGFENAFTFGQVQQSAG